MTGDVTESQAPGHHQSLGRREYAGKSNKSTEHPTRPHQKPPVPSSVPIRHEPTVPRVTAERYAVAGLELQTPSHAPAQAIRKRNETEPMKLPQTPASVENEGNVHTTVPVQSFGAKSSDEPNVFMRNGFGQDSDFVTALLSPPSSRVENYPSSPLERLNAAHISTAGNIPQSFSFAQDESAQASAAADVFGDPTSSENLSLQDTFNRTQYFHNDSSAYFTDTFAIDPDLR
ncbi:hypothetical protein GGS20DRAFT_544957 [Poronia punctata]|nr:hypothetical protein GGS20DRAFT_544957 [Poronia punctata]